ncbi:MAG: hypothetical protein CM15mP23_10910 [Cryomorphaceae bacterium]|nr:MAG: hypothetical protein CM15mP23_10910 [Cryomorphaceae bacterium]
MHTTYYLNHSKINQRLQFVRAHNIESDYYKMLAIAEKNNPKIVSIYRTFKNKIIRKEAKNADGILSISQKIMNTLIKLATVII